MKFHVVTGLPRSGSTLFCNVLSQNPLFVASNTSILPALWNALITTWSGTEEIKRDLIRDRNETHERLVASLQGLAYGWTGYDRDDTLVYFDKSRAWSANAPILRKVFPDSKIICCLRNPVNCFASEIKNHDKQPLLDATKRRTIRAKADAAFSPGGVLGSSLQAVLDLKNRQVKDVLFLRMEDFSRNPAEQMARVYEFLGEALHDHDFDNVENVSGEVDALWLDKFPHEGSGKIVPMDDLEWRSQFDVDIFRGILANPHVSSFCSEFYPDYIQRKPQQAPAPTNGRTPVKGRKLKPKWSKA